MIQQEAPQFFLFSDGGGWQTSSGGAACIIVDQETGREDKFVAFLGGATNNEAEITAALLGFSFLKAVKDTRAPIAVRWVSDSEYTLKSATKYIFKWQRNGWKTAQKEAVKNQGLWRAFLHISYGMKIFPQHVRGHAGHAENEACDGASTWVQQHGLKTLTEQGEGTIIDFAPTSLECGWVLIDGREFLEGLRNISPDSAVMELLIRKFRELQVQEGTTAVRSTISVPSLPATESDHPEWQQLLKLLHRAKEDAQALAKTKTFPPAAELAESLEEILRKHLGGFGA